MIEGMEGKINVSDEKSFILGKIRKDWKYYKEIPYAYKMDEDIIKETIKGSAMCWRYLPEILPYECEGDLVNKAVSELDTSQLFDFANNYLYEVSNDSLKKITLLELLSRFKLENVVGAFNYFTILHFTPDSMFLYNFLVNVDTIEDRFKMYLLMWLCFRKGKDYDLRKVNLVKTARGDFKVCSKEDLNTLKRFWRAIPEDGKKSFFCDVNEVIYAMDNIYNSSRYPEIVNEYSDDLEFVVRKMIKNTYIYSYNGQVCSQEGLRCEEGRYPRYITAYSKGEEMYIGVVFGYKKLSYLKIRYGDTAQDLAWAFMGAFSDFIVYLMNTFNKEVKEVTFVEDGRGRLRLKSLKFDKAYNRFFPQ